MVERSLKPWGFTGTWHFAPTNALRAWRRWFLFCCILPVVALVIALGVLIGNAMAQSGAHGDGHAEMHDHYKSWTLPGHPSSSCCSNADCRPTRAQVGDDGHWYAWNGQRWLRVEHDRLLPPDFAGDGRSHLCEKNGKLYCFTPGQIRG